MLGKQARVTSYGLDDQGEVFFYVEGEPMVFRLQTDQIDTSLIPFLAKGLGVTMNVEKHDDHYRVWWWSFVKVPVVDEGGQVVLQSIGSHLFQLMLNKDKLCFDLQQSWL